MQLFEEYPRLENDTLLIKRMEEGDAAALTAMAADPAVYRYLPTFLYEQQYADAHEVIERMDAECFETRLSILLGIYLKDGGMDPENGPETAASPFIGIAEIYNYEAEKEKASIGCRLIPAVWGKGIAKQVIILLRDYLLDEAGLRTITAHIMRENAASAGAAAKCGFFPKYPDQMEDWGFAQPVLTDKYVFKKDMPR